MNNLQHGELFAKVLIHLDNEERRRRYDPAKRKEYYERTKKLKGRKSSKANDTFRSGERNLGKNPVEQAEKARRKQADAMLDVVLNMKDQLNKLEKEGKKDTPQFSKIREYYVRALNKLSKIDPDVDWEDSKRTPEYNAQKLAELRRSKSPL